MSLMGLYQDRNERSRVLLKIGESLFTVQTLWKDISFNQRLNSFKIGDNSRLIFLRISTGILTIHPNQCGGDTITPGITESGSKEECFGN